MVTRLSALTACTAALLWAGSAVAQPGISQGVDGARGERGLFESGALVSGLSGGPRGGLTGVQLEAGYGFSSRFRATLLTEFERERGQGLRAVGTAVQGVYFLGRGPLDVETAVYAEYGFERNGGQTLELRALFERQVGRLDARLNLIAGRSLRGGDDAQYEYGAAVGYALTDRLGVGLTAFGDLGDQDGFGGRRQHFLGPTVALEQPLADDAVLALEAGYLFALGAAREESDGQFRLGVALETHF